MGSRELPAFRAGNIIVSLCDLPQVDQEHLYLDVLLLDGAGVTQDNQSGTCFAISRRDSWDERSRFVSVVAQMLRHASIDERGLPSVGPALRIVRETGIRLESLALAIQLLDEACSAQGVTRSLADILGHALGRAQAHRVMSAVVAKLALVSNQQDSQPHAKGASQRQCEALAQVEVINGGDLPSQLAFVIETVGKSRARSFLRKMTTLKLVPEPVRFDRSLRRRPAGMNT